MIAIPKDSSSTIKIVGIDPGTTKLGLSVMEVDLNTRCILSTEAMTLNGERLASNGFLTESYGFRLSRIDGICNQIRELLNYHEPFAIHSEAPFFNTLRPSAFAPLMEIICALRQVVYDYDPFKPLITVDPSSVKNAVGAKGGSDKITIKQAILNMDDINYNSTIPLDELDEHAIDSIAVNYWYYKKFIKMG